MGVDPGSWEMLERSARNILMMHAQVDALNTMVGQRMARMLDGATGVEDLHVLDHLSRDGDGTCIAQIARALRWPRTTLARVIERLKARSLVEVMVFDEDERRRTIWLTAAGHRQRVVLLEQVAMELMKVEMFLKPVRIAVVKEEARAMIEVLDGLAKKKRKRRR